MPGHGTLPFEAARAAARAAWPGVHVPDDVFRAYVAARLGDEPAREQVAAALWLACACARGDGAALRAFEAVHVPQMERAVARMRLRPEDVADVVQQLRQQLLAPGAGGAPPRIAEYAGRGDLAGWLRVAAVRAALKKLRARKPEVDADDALLAARSAGDDPELSYMKELYRRTFRESFAAALAGLDAREKNLLRQHFVDGLGVDELGRLHGVHRATAARWVQRARERLLDETRRQFMARARVSRRECESVLRLVRSRIDVTLGRLLA
jgi:RNA polymerase sigma-70 factor (ECF subfamily)